VNEYVPAASGPKLASHDVGVAEVMYAIGPSDPATSPTVWPSTVK
jgi:hypothetical protein